MTEWATPGWSITSIGKQRLPTVGYLLLASDGTPILLAEDSTGIYMANQFYE